MIRLLILLTLLFRCGPLYAEEGAFINVALLELPERYLADIPKSQRIQLMRNFCGGGDDKRLSYAGGWVHWCNDGVDIAGTSMFYLKLLPRKNDRPLVLVHMLKPFADGSTPAANQTFVLAWNGRDWSDVTADVMPQGIDMTMHFRPERSSRVIEAAPWIKVQRRDGRGDAWVYGSRKFDLVWNGSTLQKRKAAKSVLTRD